MIELYHPTTGLTLFKEKELASPDTGEVRLATSFAEYLVKLRVKYGLPMIVNSCCRSMEHNTSVGGHPRSLHLMHNLVHKIDGTAAIDIHVESDTVRGRLISVAWQEGWSVGVGKTFTHLDARFLLGFAQKMFVYS